MLKNILKYIDKFPVFLWKLKVQRAFLFILPSKRQERNNEVQRQVRRELKGFTSRHKAITLPIYLKA